MDALQVEIAGVCKIKDEMRPPTIVATLSSVVAAARGVRTSFATNALGGPILRADPPHPRASASRVFSDLRRRAIGLFDRRGSG